MATQATPAVVTRRNVKDALKNNSALGSQPSRQFQPFLPQDAIQSLIQKERVISTLNSWFPKSNSIETLANYVMNRGRIVFLTLLYMEAPKRIGPLEAANLKDEHLPIWVDEDENAFSLLSDDTLGQTLPCFTDWDSDRHREDFQRDQWIFMAPIFTEDQFDYVFQSFRRLPFLSSGNPNSSAGHFGTIHKARLHVEHQKLDAFYKRFQANDGHIEIALKELTTQNAPDATDVSKFYPKEMKTLQTMRDLKHPHLIRAIAAFKRGEERYFVFPWADEGDLNNLWENHSQNTLDQGLMSWAINQMKGISEGIKELHGTITRHGDIKPGNILCFRSHVSGSDQRTLVIADVGLAKVHEDYTRYRYVGTTTRYGTVMYDPPETPTYNKEVPVSRLYDIWSLGCVFLEFAIWLVQGWNGLQKFRQDLKRDESDSRFWLPTGERNPAVENWINNEFQSSARHPALRDLVDLISQKLLISERNGRINALNLVKELEGIQSKVSTLSNMANAEVAGPARTRPQAEDSPREPATHLSNQLTSLSPKKPESSDMIQPRTSKLNDRWQNKTDNNWANHLISFLDWPTLRPTIDTSRTCQSCSNLDFGSSYLDLGRTLQQLDLGSDDCSLCYFLYHCLSRATPELEGSVRLFRDDSSHIFRANSSSDTAAISIYLEQDSHDTAPSYAQPGLPLLPVSGSSQQFKLLEGLIQLCDTTHDCLSGRDSVPAMPTRLIDVGKDGNFFLRLVEVNDNIRGEYAALSHCWGKLSKEERFCTSVDNIESLKKDILYDALPKTFQDAVKVTRGLGIQYLWIDSLCIIQGDDKDWEAEAGKMEDVFSSAYCVIAASSATSSLQGFLERAQRVAITVKTSRGLLHLAEPIDDFQSHVERGALNKRGWVFQERALARRTIHFTSTQVYWECGKGIFCETLAHLTNPQSQFLGDSNFPGYMLQHYKDERIRLVHYLYGSYSGLSLTKDSDRSKAILGLQKRLSRTFNLKQEHGLRAAYGIVWAFFERTLLWQAKASHGMSRIKYDKNQAVPSWSWMAYMGKIQYMDIPFNRVNWVGGFEHSLASLDEGAEWDGRLFTQSSQLSIEEVELSERSTMDVADCTFDPVNDRCIVVGTSKDKIKNGGISQYVLLIRQKSSTESPPLYERVGVSILLDTHIVSGRMRVCLV